MVFLKPNVLSIQLPYMGTGESMDSAPYILTIFKPHLIRTRAFSVYYTQDKKKLAR